MHTERKSWRRFWYGWRHFSSRRSPTASSNRERYRTTDTGETTDVQTEFADHRWVTTITTEGRQTRWLVDVVGGDAALGERHAALAPKPESHFGLTRSKLIGERFDPPRRTDLDAKVTSNVTPAGVPGDEDVVEVQYRIEPGSRFASAAFSSREITPMIWWSVVRCLRTG
jgi:hypothetical protein